MSRSSMRASLLGHLPASHSLSPRRAFQCLPPMAGAMVAYEPNSIWEQDTASLPEPLAELRRRSREFAERELRPRALSGDLQPHHAQTDREVLRRAAESGVLFDHLPAPVGSGETVMMDYPQHWAAAIKSEELCAACGGWGLFLAAHFLGMVPVLISGDKKAMKRFLIPANRETAAGRPHLFAFAITEPAGGSDVEDGDGAATFRPATIAKRADGGWTLNGRKIYISGGDIANAVLVFGALEDEGISSWTCFLVESDRPGFRRGRNELKMGQRASGATELEFDGVFVPDDHVIGGLRNGWALNRATLNYSRIPVGAVALGIARGAMEAAMDFTCSFWLAGKPLIDYQEIQLRVAGMITETTAMRAMLWHHGSRRVPTQANASACKIACSDAAVRVCESAMEILGNHGVLHAGYAEKGFRDARLTQIYEGTNEINRLAVIEDLQESFLQALNNQNDGERQS